MYFQISLFTGMWKRWAWDEVKGDPELAINYGYMFLYYSLATASAAFCTDPNGYDTMSTMS